MKTPKGAITSEKELLFALLGQPLYLVHGLGASSYMDELHNVSNLHSIDKYRVFDYVNIEYGYTTQCFLGDCNIGSHHNDHYLFRNKEDACEYLRYAKIYTKSPNSRRQAFYT